jgi:hypothetical protein
MLCDDSDGDGDDADDDEEDFQQPPSPRLTFAQRFSPSAAFVATATASGSASSVDADFMLPSTSVFAKAGVDGVDVANDFGASSSDDDDDDDDDYDDDDNDVAEVSFVDVDINFAPDYDGYDHHDNAAYDDDSDDDEDDDDDDDGMTRDVYTPKPGNHILAKDALEKLAIYARSFAECVRFDVATETFQLASGAVKTVVASYQWRGGEPATFRSSIEHTFARSLLSNLCASVPL